MKPKISTRNWNRVQGLAAIKRKLTPSDIVEEALREYFMKLGEEHGPPANIKKPRNP